MSETEIKAAEESAPMTEEIKEQEDISKNYTPTELAKARQRYIKGKKEDAEVLKVDVEVMKLQIEHYELSRKIAEINKEVQKAKATEEFKEKLKV